jgi:hypothetical protein
MRPLAIATALLAAASALAPALAQEFEGWKAQPCENVR